MKNHSSAWLAALLVLAPWLACAQSSPAPRETFEVFAPRALPQRADAPQAVTVITRAEIERRAATSIPELLREVPGLHVDQLGATGAANVYVRGAEPNHTVILVDGLRVNDPTDARGGSFDLGAFSLEEIERIEVLRGASSAQFGADAIGGVVNIVTRRPDASRWRAHASGGGHGFAQAGLHAARPFGVPLGASVAHREDGRESLGGESRRRFAQASLRHAAGSRELDLMARAADFEVSGFPESSGGIRLARNRALERREGHDAAGVFTWRERFGAVRWLARVGSTLHEEQRLTPAVAPGPGGFVPAAHTDARFRRGGGVVQAGFTAGRTGEFLVGAESWRERGERDSTLFLPGPLPSAFDLERDHHSAHVEWQARIGEALGLLAALRHDDVDPGGKRTTRSAGMRYAVDAANSLRASWNEGFKPASFFALADPLIGNPALGPETSRGSEIGWEWRSADSFVQLTAFASRVRGLVDFDPGSFRMVNREGARTRGAEASALQRLGAWRVAASYTYVDTELLGSDVPLRNRPRHRGTVSLEGDWRRWSSRLAIVRVGSTHDFSVPTGLTRLSPYTRVDAMLRYRERGWAIGLAIDNLTDRALESYVGFASPGRRARAFVEATFGS